MGVLATVRQLNHGLHALQTPPEAETPSLQHQDRQSSYVQLDMTNVPLVLRVNDQYSCIPRCRLQNPEPDGNKRLRGNNELDERSLYVATKSRFCAFFSSAALVKLNDPVITVDWSMIMILLRVMAWQASIALISPFHSPSPSSLRDTEIEPQSLPE
jgi:hypothetical protein